MEQLTIFTPDGKYFYTCETSDAVILALYKHVKLNWDKYMPSDCEPLPSRVTMSEVVEFVKEYFAQMNPQEKYIRKPLMISTVENLKLELNILNGDAQEEVELVK